MASFRSPPTPDDSYPTFPTSRSRFDLDRSSHSIVCSLNSCLLRSSSPFPYYMVLSLEGGSPLRAFLLLLLFPFAWLLSCSSDTLSTRFFIFISTAGLPLSEVECVSKAVLPKFYLDDIYGQAFETFVACGKRYVVTSYPRIMVEYFLKEHLGVDEVLGTELQVIGGRRSFCTGLVQKSGVLTGKKKADAVKKLFGDRRPDIALGSGASDYSFLSLGKEAYLVDTEVARDNARKVHRNLFRKPLVFHDGRFVQRPTPLQALALFLWAPAGLILVTLRILIVECLPLEVGMPIAAMVGLSVRVKGAPPLPLSEGNHKQGVLFVSSHRTLMDSTSMCVGLRRKVRALAYSVSRVSEALSPIKIASLTRDREQDRKLMAGFLEAGEDVFVSPEGTTCREPYLLRFSALFAELTEQIVPVGIKLKVSMFHGTSARGYKALDPFFFLMNPRPEYEIMFMARLKEEETVGKGGKSGVEVARSVQRKVGAALGFTCTELTRRDKYMVLAGNDGSVATSTKAKAKAI